MDTKIFRSMSYGVYVVTTMDKGRPTGCIANSVMQITSSPATIAVSMNHDNYTNSCIRESGIFAYSVLSEESDPGIIGTFGFQSGKAADKFESVRYEMVSGAPVITDSCGYVVCKVINKMETSTHTIFLGEVIDAGSYAGAASQMTYAYYHQVIKGKSPKNAPTYLPEEPKTVDSDKSESKAEEKTTSKYVCQICGYVHEADELPVDFVCPVCKQGAEVFKKV